MSGNYYISYTIYKMPYGIIFMEKPDAEIHLRYKAINGRNTKQA